ncbi:unnamed protein product [Adineta ricciae]|uniref:Uncharacterized protein n=1 Tax=Adineta ricciae TaxID=249248 RepID=A0A816EA71_ADIRI|nr:unnamed protein product [Adineta ricciae]
MTYHIAYGEATRISGGQAQTFGGQAEPALATPWLRHYGQRSLDHEKFREMNLGFEIRDLDYPTGNHFLTTIDQFH